MTDQTPPPSGPAGRRLLAELDRLTTTAEPSVVAHRTRTGDYRLAPAGSRDANGRAPRAYQFSTIRRLGDAGLLRWEPTNGGTTAGGGTGYRLTLTPAGRTILGA